MTDDARVAVSASKDRTRGAQRHRPRRVGALLHRGARARGERPLSGQHGAGRDDLPAVQYGSPRRGAGRRRPGSARAASTTSRSRWRRSTRCSARERGCASAACRSCSRAGGGPAARSPSSSRIPTATTSRSTGTSTRSGRMAPRAQRASGARRRRSRTPSGTRGGPAAAPERRGPLTRDRKPAIGRAIGRVTSR